MNQFEKEAVLVTMLLFSDGGKYTPSHIVFDSRRYVSSIEAEFSEMFKSLKRLEEKGVIEELPDNWYRDKGTDPIVRFSTEEENIDEPV